MSHVNPDGKMVDGSTPEKTLAAGHIYSQLFEHGDARIVGNRLALQYIRKAITQALAFQPTDADSWTRSEEIFAADGEGYNVAVKILPDEILDPAKHPMIDDLWKRFPPHYCDRGYDDDDHPGPEASEIERAIAKVIHDLRDMKDTLRQKGQL